MGKNDCMNELTFPYINVVSDFLSLDMMGKVKLVFLIFVCRLTFQFISCFEFGSIVNHFAEEFQTKRFVIHGARALGKVDVKSLMKR